MSLTSCLIASNGPALDPVSAPTVARAYDLERYLMSAAEDEDEKSNQTHPPPHATHHIHHAIHHASRFPTSPMSWLVHPANGAGTQLSI